MEKLIILGTGIAGLTAAIYSARAELSPLLISGGEDGGQLMLTSEIENFPGFPEKIAGAELIERCKKQAERFGARFKEDSAAGLKKIKGGFELSLQSKEKLQTKALIIATGASARWLGIPSEKKFQGRGVSVCANCDAAFYKNKTVIVVGGGDVAMEDALFLAKFTDKITLAHRKEEFRASRIMQERVLKNKKIKIVWNTEIKEFYGDKFLEGVELLNNKTNKTTDFKCDGVFLAIGHVPNTKFLEGKLEGKLELDEKGYLKADKSMRTGVEGIFAAGDVQDYRFRQAITAAGSGCMAAMEAEKYLGE